MLYYCYVCNNNNKYWVSSHRNLEWLSCTTKEWHKLQILFTSLQTFGQSGAVFYARWQYISGGDKKNLYIPSVRGGGGMGIAKRTIPSQEKGKIFGRLVLDSAA